MAYVSARDKDKSSHDVVYIDQSGRQLVRHAGSRAWRNNNPGNIRSGIFASEHGAIGSAGGFAVFPDYETGRSALVALLQTEAYAKLTIIKAVSHYAPPKENDSKAYARHLEKLTGLDGKVKLGDLKVVQIESVARAIEKLEGTLPGTEMPFAKVVGVVKERGRIVAYELDNGAGLLGKAQALVMAQAGQIDAVVVTGKAGAYLRSRPDDTTADNLEAMEIASS